MVSLATLGAGGRLSSTKTSARSSNSPWSGLLLVLLLLSLQALAPGLGIASNHHHHQHKHHLEDLFHDSCDLLLRRLTPSAPARRLHHDERTSRPETKHEDERFLANLKLESLLDRSFPPLSPPTISASSSPPPTPYHVTTSRQSRQLSMFDHGYNRRLVDVAFGKPPDDGDGLPSYG